MTNFFLNFEKEETTSLNSVIYKSIPFTSDAENFKISLQDDIEPTLTEDGLLINAIRRLQMVPEVLFYIEVSFHVFVPFSCSADKEFVKTANLKEILLAEKRVPWVSNAFARASLLISQLTFDDGEQPIVTPPSFTK